MMPDHTLPDPDSVEVRIGCIRDNEAEEAHSASMEVVQPRDSWNPSDHYRPTGLSFDGCACAEGDVDGTYIDAHCHRTNHDCDCRFAGVHYDGDHDTALRVADYIANAYGCDVTLCVTTRPTCHGTGVK